MGDIKFHIEFANRIVIFVGYVWAFLLLGCIRLFLILFAICLRYLSSFTCRFQRTCK